MNKKMIRIIKKLAKKRRYTVAKLLSVLSYIFPVKSYYFSWANYHSGSFSKARRCLPDDISHPLRLKILYTCERHCPESLSALFNEENKSFDKYIGRLNNIIVFQYINNRFNEDVAVEDVVSFKRLKASKKKKKFLIYCIYYFYKKMPQIDLKTSYYTNYQAANSLSRCLRLTGNCVDEFAEDSVMREQNPIPRLMRQCRHDPTLMSELLAGVPESEKMQFIIRNKFLIFRKESFNTLMSNGDLQDSFLNRKNKHAIKLLNYARSVGDKNAYINFYKRIKPLSAEYYLWLLFFSDKYNAVVKIATLLSVFRLDIFYERCLYIVYLSHVSISAAQAIDFIKMRQKRGLEISSYGVLNALYVGDVVGAELKRAELELSLEGYLNRRFKKITQKDMANTESVLFIAEQGVADEVRWARLYSRINRSNVTITCDHRFYQLFSSSFPHITFIPVARDYRKPRDSTIEEFHHNALPSNVCLEQYDCISSTSMLFVCLPEAEIKTRNDTYLKVTDLPAKSSKKKIGIMWSSSFAPGLRGHRYAIDKQHYISLIKETPHYEYYCLQSPMTENDTMFCQQNGINVVDHVDLYNDFNKSSSFLASLDYVIGPSSLNTELAAACGTTFFHIANAKEVASMRNGDLDLISSHDQLSENTVTIYPIQNYGERSNYEITKDCFDHLKLIIKKL
jgi:hypothetical protein